MHNQCQAPFLFIYEFSRCVWSLLRCCLSDQSRLAKITAQRVPGERTECVGELHTCSVFIHHPGQLGLFYGASVLQAVAWCCVFVCVFQTETDCYQKHGRMHWCTLINLLLLSWFLCNRGSCSWKRTALWLAICNLFCRDMHRFTSGLWWLLSDVIVSLCGADPEAALQQQHGRTPFPLAVSSWICGVAASKQQGDPTVWQKQCARTTGNCPIPLNDSVDI